MHLLLVRFIFLNRFVKTNYPIILLMVSIFSHADIVSNNLARHPDQHVGKVVQDQGMPPCLTR